MPFGGGGGTGGGGAVTVPLVLTGTAPGARVLEINTPNTQTAAAIIAQDANLNDYFSVGGSNGVTLSADAVTGNTEVQITTSALTYRDELGHVVLDIEGGYISLGQSGTVFVTPNNYLATSNHAAPADGELGAGDCALWFDQTDGVGNTKMMFKGKSADGTVKTASIVLA